ncbi:MAG TPA: hypothetical protein VJT73_09445 [Polyangiaceae bacterium]|nr:hypothetical protein [Polyangiaceae bacterium]
MRKHRLSASVDANLIAAAERAVADGRAENVSAWVNAAMRLQVEHDLRMRALGDFVAAYESKHGLITEAEMTAARRRARARAVVVRAPRQKRGQSA